MNELQVFKNQEFDPIKQIERSRSSDYIGFIYVLEWGDAVKIGSTMYPYKRLCALKRQAESYGNIKLGNFALSQEHTNYKENERKLHDYFRKFRKKNTELFDVSIRHVALAISECVSFSDESEVIEQKSKDACDMFKRLLMGAKR